MNGTTAANPPLLQCTGLYKSYGRGNVLNGIDLTVSRGRIVGLLGPNGSGKTTLLKLIAGLLTPTAGEILVDGLEIGVETKKIVSYLPERTYFDDSMTVADTVISMRISTGKRRMSLSTGWECRTARNSGRSRRGRRRNYSLSSS